MGVCSTYSTCNTCFLSHVIHARRLLLAGGVYASADAARVGGGLYLAVVEALCTLATDPAPRVSGRCTAHACVVHHSPAEGRLQLCSAAAAEVAGPGVTRRSVLMNTDMQLLLQLLHAGPPRPAQLDARLHVPGPAAVGGGRGAGGAAGGQCRACGAPPRCQRQGRAGQGGGGGRRGAFLAPEGHECDGCQLGWVPPLALALLPPVLLLILLLSLLLRA